MATTIVSNLAIFSDGTGHGNQSHLVYALNQQRWWLFVYKTKTASAVSCYVSSSSDLTTATWSASTDSPALTTACSSNDQRNLGVVSFANGTTDVVHIDTTTSASAAIAATVRRAHIRATLTGTNSITWESWVEETATNGAVSAFVRKGNTLGVSTTGVVHRCQDCNTNGSGNNAGDPLAARMTNADSGATWTSGVNATVAVDDSMVGVCVASALGQLASDAMLLVFPNATSSGSETVSTGLRFNKYTSGTTWPANTGNADVGIGTSSQDENDWCLCVVDATHIYAFRRDSSNTYLYRLYNGSTWSTPANTVPNQNHTAGSGLFATTDGTSLWLFVLDTAAGNPVKYCQYTLSSGTWGSWTILESASTNTRNFISGNPAVSNSQIGVIWTETNGSNFDIVVSALSITPPVAPVLTTPLLVGGGPGVVTANGQVFGIYR
jgi:hypothetical protein